MANRDFRKIERIMKDFSMGVGEGGGTSEGGMILVDTLPEVGKEDTLYKTPDGKIWSCTNSMEKILEVGQNYTFLSEINFTDLKNYVNAHKVSIYFNNDSGHCIYSNIILGPEVGKEEDEYLIEYYEDDGDTGLVHYKASVESTIEKVEAELEIFTEMPTVTIDENFASMAEENGVKLSELSFLFNCEEKLVSTWTEVGSGASGGDSELIFGYEIADLDGKHVSVDKLIALLQKYNVPGTGYTYLNIGSRNCTDTYSPYAIMDIGDQSGLAFELINTQYGYIGITYSEYDFYTILQENKTYIESLIINKNYGAGGYTGYLSVALIYLPLIVAYPNTTDGSQEYFKVTKQEILDLFVD